MKTATMQKEEVKTEEMAKKDSFKQKASLFNFIIYTHEEKRVPTIEKLSIPSSKNFPAALSLSKEILPDEKDEFKTEITLKTAGPIACDHIEIHAGGTHLIQVPFYILPHLEPDLPIYLLWGQDPTSESEVLPRLVKYADRLIFDSECGDKIQKFSGKILSSLKSFPCQVLDMNWARLAGWRHVIANAMDSSERIDQLTHANEVTIVYNSHTTDAFSHTETQADYLQAWLATRLGWKYSSNSHDGNTTVLDYSGIRIRLTPQKVSVFTPGSIMSFIVSTEDGHQFNIERHEDNLRQVVVNISSKEKCWLPITMPLLTHTKGPSFIRELLYAHPSYHYNEMLEIISNENL